MTIISIVQFDDLLWIAYSFKREKMSFDIPSMNWRPKRLNCIADYANRMVTKLKKII